MITISFFKSKEQRKQKCNYYEKFKIIKGIRNKTVPPRNPSAGEGRKYNDLNSYLLGSQEQILFRVGRKVKTQEDMLYF